MGRCKGWVNSAIIITDVITCKYFFKYKYSVKMCMYNRCIASND